MALPRLPYRLDTVVLVLLLDGPLNFHGVLEALLEDFGREPSGLALRRAFTRLADQWLILPNLDNELELTDEGRRVAVDAWAFLNRAAYGPPLRAPESAAEARQSHATKESSPRV